MRFFPEYHLDAPNDLTASFGSGRVEEVGVPTEVGWDGRDVRDFVCPLPWCSDST